MSKPVPGFIVEGYARQLVPEEQLGRARRVFFIVTGALCGLPVYVLAGQVVNGTGLARARWVFLVGGLVAGSLGALGAYAGARTRMNLAMIADEAFGRLGGRVVKTMIALSLIGWVGVILSVLGTTAGSAIHGVYGVTVDPVWIAVGATVAVSAITLRGVKGLEHVGIVIAPLLLAILVWTFQQGCAKDAPQVPAIPPGSLGFGAAVSAVIGAYIIGITIQPDYGRFVRRPVRAGIASGLALGVAFPAILTFSAIPTYRCGAPDLISVMVTLGIGLPALALLVLGAWIDASVCLYSGSLSLTNEVKRFELPWVTVTAAVSSCLLSVLHAERHFMPFVELLGVIFPPVAAISILHVLIGIRRQREGAAAALPLVRWPAAAAWLAGSVTGYLTAYANVTLSGIAAIDSILVATTVWAIGFFWRDEPCVPQPSGDSNA